MYDSKFDGVVHTSSWEIVEARTAEEPQKQASGRMMVCLEYAEQKKIFVVFSERAGRLILQEKLETSSRTGPMLLSEEKWT